MKHHLNTLFVCTQGAYVGKDGEALEVRIDGQAPMRVPIVNLGGVVCFGRVGWSPAAMALCASAGVAVSLCARHGGFQARVTGYSPGNVLLRREQYRQADDAAATAEIARGFLLGKLSNCRTVLLRGARDRPDEPAAGRLEDAAGRIRYSLAALQRATSLDEMRGIEGEAASLYFGAFEHLIVKGDPFRFTARSRRPPLDRTNALLSFLYAMLAHDARAACEAAGLDAAVGFHHRDRPGRPGLALDLMEEFRPVLADRVAMTLINRGQVSADGFIVEEAGAVTMTDPTRRKVLEQFQARKQETIIHPFLRERTTFGLLIHLQARLLARYLRGELDAYPPFFWR